MTENRLVPFRRTPVLLYHRIARSSPVEDPMGLAVSPGLFEKQMRYLHERGIRTARPKDMPANDLHSDVRSGNTVLITFDDGFLDTYENAFPVLMRYGFTATVFIVANYVGGTSFWRPKNEQHSLMRWEHIREMAKYGIDIQNHTLTHMDLTTAETAEIIRQIIASKYCIEDRTGLPVSFLAYPFGHCNLTVMKLAEDAGYLNAFTAGASNNAGYCLERIAVYEWDSAMRFKLKAGGWGSWIRSMTSRVHTIRGRS